MNALTNIPDSLRKQLYIVYGLLGVVIGAIQVGYLASSSGQPQWLTVVLAVFGFVGTAFGTLAQANVTPGSPTTERTYD